MRLTKGRTFDDGRGSAKVCIYSSLYWYLIFLRCVVLLRCFFTLLVRSLFGRLPLHRLPPGGAVVVEEMENGAGSTSRTPALFWLFFFFQIMLFFTTRGKKKQGIPWSDNFLGAPGKSDVRVPKSTFHARKS